MLRSLLLAVGLGLCAGATAAHALTVNEVIGLLDAGVGESVVLDQIEAEGAHFDLSARQILLLKEAGATDEFIRALIRTGRDRLRSGVTGSRGLIRDELADPYASPGVRVHLYYDPFGYHWYSWPWAYAYYDPFPWFDCGFYYAGWWDCRWWRWGSWCVDSRARYCDAGPGRWHRDRWRVEGGRHAWSRVDRDGRRDMPVRDPDGRRYGAARDRRSSDRAFTRAPSSRPPAGDRSRRWSPGGGDSRGGGRGTLGAPSRSTPGDRTSARSGGWRR